MQIEIAWLAQSPGVDITGGSDENSLWVVSAQKTCAADVQNVCSLHTQTGERIACV